MPAQAVLAKYSRVRKDLTGQVYGNLTVLGLDSFDGSKSRWRCLCACGIEIAVSVSNLRRQKGCRDCRPRGENHPAWGGCGEIYGHWWRTHVVRNAKHRRPGREVKVLLSIEDAWLLFLRQERRCALSGLPLVFGSDTTASLDRIDSSKDYSVDNVQWVHKHINKMKQDLPQDYFIELCQKVAS